MKKVFFIMYFIRLLYVKLSSVQIQFSTILLYLVLHIMFLLLLYVNVSSDIDFFTSQLSLFATNPSKLINLY